jgi:hypothetical protein
MSALDKEYEDFIKEMMAKADSYIQQKYGLPPEEDDESTKEEEAPDICTAKEFKDACEELGLTICK